MTKTREVHKMVVLLLLSFLILAASVSVSAAPDSKTEETTSETKKVKNGLQKINKSWFYYKNGVPVKKKFVTIKKKLYYFKKGGRAAIGWLKISGKKYYFDNKGRAAKGLTEVGNASYYFSSTGVIQTGWQKIGEKWAFFNEKTGKMKKNGTVDGVKIKASGYAAPTAKQKKMLAVQGKVEAIAKSITTSSMSKSQKLNAIWSYITSTSRFRYARRYDFSAYAGWEYDYGYDLLASKAGNCYRFACAFALLAKSVGYKPYVLWGLIPHRNGVDMTEHCFVRIDGLYYDPEAQFAGWAPGIKGTGIYPMTFVQRGAEQI